ncbi:MAG: 3-oxoacyl-[acyl-carrier protein] reductase, partial [Blastocatellia bacterium]|nr:3-oxoacyl-[acyl-carrier protein] reductase [Blastocatellia bacterium]
METSPTLLASLNLNDRVALVTGGSRGIGRAAVNCFATLGANVVINYVKDDEAASAAVAEAQKSGVDALAVRADVSRLAEAEHLIQEVIKKFGRLDFLVCNAGIWEGGAVDALSEDAWDRTMDLNLKGTWAACRAAVPAMKAQSFGRVVIVSS